MKIIVKKNENSHPTLTLEDGTIVGCDARTAFAAARGEAPPILGRILFRLFDIDPEVSIELVQGEG